MEQIKGRSSIEQVKEFHEVFGHKVANKPGEETLEERQLRLKLQFEELEELAAALDCNATFNELCVNRLYKDDRVAKPLEVDGDNVDYVAVLDALTDSQVILDGTYCVLGFYDVKDEAFAEVHRSNMSKSLPMGVPNVKVTDHLSKLINDGKMKFGSAQQRGDYIIFVREDGKILKGPDFSEPNLEQFVKVYYWYSDAKGYFITTTPFAEEEKGLRSSTYDEYKQNR